VEILSLVSLFVVIGLLVLFAISFALFIRRLLVNSSAKNNKIAEIEKKLDKIIDLIEKQKLS